MAAPLPFLGGRPGRSCAPPGARPGVTGIPNASRAVTPFGHRGPMCSEESGAEAAIMQLDTDDAALERFSALDDEAGRGALHACCASPVWGARVWAGRPYRSRAELLG